MSPQHETTIQIPVRMGSHRFQVSKKADEAVMLTSLQLVELVIEKCHLYGSDRLRRTYTVYESLNGVERRMRPDENVLDVLRVSSTVPQVEFVVRKLNRVEKQLAEIKRSEQARLLEKRCYRKLKCMRAEETKRREQELGRIEVYEDIDRDECMVEMGLRERIRENERILKMQADKLMHLEKSILKRIDQLSVVSAYENANEVKIKNPKTRIREVPNQKTSSCSSSASSSLLSHQCSNEVKLGENIGILRTLYTKLRAVQTSRKTHQHSSLNNKSFSSTCSRLALLSAADGMNSCGNSSCDDDNEDATSKSTRSSTSTLESLV